MILLSIQPASKLAWTASFVTMERTLHKGPTDKSSGMLVAVPLENPRAGLVVKGVRLHGKTCEADAAYTTDLLSPGSTTMRTRLTVQPAGVWWNKLVPHGSSGSAAIKSFKLESVSKESCYGKNNVRWLKSTGEQEGSVISQYLPEMWPAYVRQRMQEMGMPEDMDGVPPADFVEALRKKCAPTDVEFTWEVVCVSLCNVQTAAGRVLVFELLGPNEGWAQFATTSDWWMGMSLSHAAVGVASAKDLRSTQFDFGKYEDGLTRAEFMLREPIVLTEEYEWYRLDKFWRSESGSGTQET